MLFQDSSYWLASLLLVLYAPVYGSYKGNWRVSWAVRLDWES